MTIHPRLLRYIDEVARSGSIRRAAGRLNVAASSINRQIIALEEQLDTPLFERLPRRMRLTAAGEVIVAHARQSLREHERMLERIEALKGPRHAQSSIATVGGLASGVLMHALAGFRRERLFARFVISVTSAEAVAAAVAADEADIGFAFDLPRTPLLTVAARVASPCGAVVTPDHPLAGRGRLGLGDLMPFPLIVPRKGVSVRDHLDGVAQRQGLRIEPVIESDSFELLKQFALLDGGVAILNRIDVAHSQASGAVRFIAVEELRGFMQELSVVHRSRGTLDPLSSQLVERLREAVAPGRAP